MNEILESSPNPRSYPKWLWLVVALVLIMGAVATYSFFLGRKVDARLATIKAAGYPVTGYDLNQWDEQVPLTENAAPKFIEAARSMSSKGKPLGDLKFPARSEPLSSEAKTNLQEILANNDKALGLIREGTRLPRSRYPVQWQAGPATLLPHLAQVKSEAQLLQVEALLAAEEGNTRLALQDIKGTVKAAESLATEPCTISQLVRISCLNIAVTELERLLNKRALNPQQCEDLQKVFQAAEAGIQKGVTRALIGERCLGTFVFGMSASQIRSFGNELPLLYAVGEFTGIRKADFLFYLDMMENAIKASELPFPESLEKTRQLGASTAAEITHHPFFMMSKLLMPALEKSTAKTAKTVAELRSAQAALALERYRLQNGGQLPEGLQQLVPSLLAALPIDPFNGKPLRYEWVKPGFLLYSIGEDGKDDGGAESSKPHSNVQEGDLVFKVER